MLRRRHWIICITFVVASVALYQLSSVHGQEEETTQPAAAGPSTAPAVVSDAAKAVLGDMDKAYGALKGLKLNGTFSFVADVSGQTANEQSDFVSSFAGPVNFRHEVKDQLTLGYTGTNAFVYLKDRNIYVSKPLPPQKFGDGILPEAIGNVISSQNPSLLMAVAAAPSESLTKGFATVEKSDDVTIDSTAYISLTMRNDSELTTVLVDPTTHLIRKVSSDLRQLMTRRGADLVKKAEFTIDYTTVTPGDAAAATEFAWTAPDEARDITNNMQELASSGGGAADAMVNKPAPDFTLETLDGKKLKLSSLKGQVVVLDFWATWCGPCMQSLPHLNEFNDKNKDDKVTVIAVDVGETKQQVSGVVSAKKWSFTVALDTDGAVSESFSVDGFPTTMVVDPAGVIRNVTVGYNPAMAAGGGLQKIVDGLKK